MTQQWIEIQIESSIDAGELLGMLDNRLATGAWQDNGLIRLYWPGDAWSPKTCEELKAVLQQAGGDPSSMRIETLSDRDWNALWAASIKPIRIGRRVVVRPTWEPVALAAGDVELILDPKQAFGTGHHATTRMLVEWLEERIAGGERVLDVGTGSGILAMVALRFGAASALALDHDPVAIDCARGYAAQNGFGAELDLRTGMLTDMEPRRFDLVLANLDRQTLVQQAAVFSGYLRPGRPLLASGLLREDRDDVTAAYGRAGAVVREVRESDGWLALELTFFAERPA